MDTILKNINSPGEKIIIYISRLSIIIISQVICTTIGAMAE